MCAPLAVLALLAPGIPNGTVAVEYRGTVSQTSLAISPLAGAQQGDTVVLRFEVDVPGVPFVPGSATDYPLDLGEFSITAGGGVVHGDPTLNPTHLRMIDELGGSDQLHLDGLVVQNHAISIFLIDPTRLAFSGAAIELETGTYTTAHFSDAWVMHGLAGTMEVDFTELVVSAATQGDIGARFCQSEPNTTGAPTTIRAFGSPSLLNNDLSLSAGPIPPGQPGIFFYGPHPDQVPFGNGWRCVTGGFYRFPRQPSSPAGTVTFAIDNSLSPAATGAGAWTAGSTWRFQCWYRDPTATTGFRFNLSDGLAITFVP